MSLFDRLIGSDPTVDKIHVHQFSDALGEWEDGETGARARIVAFWSLDAAEDAELNQLKAIAQGSTNKTEFIQVFERCFRLGEIGFPGYTTQAEIVARLQRVP